MTVFTRNIDQLEKYAILWWPKKLMKMESSTSIIPLLLKTQEEFISIINLCKDGHEQVFDVLDSSKFSANLFLKHLMVLCDFGGEQVQRLNMQFRSVFPKSYLEYALRGMNHKYVFKTLPVKGALNNKRMSIDGNSLLANKPIDDLKKDLITMLLFGSNSLDEHQANVLQKCMVGNLLGKPEEIKSFVRQRYIMVSRITGGAQSNQLGQVAQTYLYDMLKRRLGDDFSVSRNGKIVSNGTSLPFDIVVSKRKRHVGIEISFQVTTNSVIERKAGQAANRHAILKKAGNYIAYVIDGAGNFQRRSAVSRICENSDCTVGFSDAEFEILLKFIKAKLA